MERQCHLAVDLIYLIVLKFTPVLTASSTNKPMTISIRTIPQKQVAQRSRSRISTISNFCVVTLANSMETAESGVFLMQNTDSAQTGLGTGHCDSSTISALIELLNRRSVQPMSFWWMVPLLDAFASAGGFSQTCSPTKMNQSLRSHTHNERGPSTGHANQYPAASETRKWCVSSLLCNFLWRFTFE